MTTPSTPFERSYWVVPGKLLAGYYPGDRDPETSRAKLQALVDASVRHVIDLVEEERLDDSGRPIDYPSQLAEIAEAKGVSVTYSHNPITDLGIPSREKMKSILDDVDAAIANGKTVYVHCLAGIGRTGSVVGCYLSRHGIAVGPQALDMIRRLRVNDPNVAVPSPESDIQRRLVRSWKVGE